jgi:hypothetical protein
LKTFWFSGWTKQGLSDFTWVECTPGKALQWHKVQGMYCTLWNMCLQLIDGVILSTNSQEFLARELVFVFVFVSLLIFRASNGIPYCSWGSVLGWAEGSAWSADMNRCRSFETSVPRGVSSWPYVRHEAHIGLELESLTREAHASLTTWPTLLIWTCACMRRIRAGGGRPPCRWPVNRWDRSAYAWYARYSVLNPWN